MFHVSIFYLVSGIIFPAAIRLLVSRLRSPVCALQPPIPSLQPRFSVSRLRSAVSIYFCSFIPQRLHWIRPRRTNRLVSHCKNCDADGNQCRLKKPNGLYRRAINVILKPPTHDEKRDRPGDNIRRENPCDKVSRKLVCNISHSGTHHFPYADFLCPSLNQERRQSKKTQA